jgi:hypothetical protein
MSTGSMGWERGSYGRAGMWAPSLIFVIDFADTAAILSPLVYSGRQDGCARTKSCVVGFPSG